MSVIINPSSGSGANPFKTLDFTYTTTSPALLQAVATGQIIDRAIVVITTPFDGIGASVALGTTANPSLILTAGDVNVGTSDQYSTESITEFAMNDFLQFTIQPSGSTQGAGLLLYIIATP